MIKVGLKEFRRNTYKYLNQLPVQVIRKSSRFDKEGTVVFIVQPPPKGLIASIFGANETKD